MPSVNVLTYLLTYLLIYTSTYFLKYCRTFALHSYLWTEEITSTDITDIRVTELGAFRGSCLSESASERGFIVKVYVYLI